MQQPADYVCRVKRPYLVVHDYGMGGLWAYVWAETPEDVEGTFEAEVVYEPPDWLLGHKPGVVTLDIDDPPPDWLPLR
jgi:hypothetical protein